jgi:hypothetical protein
MADNAMAEKSDWPPPMAPFFNDYVQAGIGTLLFALAFAVIVVSVGLIVDRVQGWRRKVAQANRPSMANKAGGGD